ncbi:MAG TPA: hypothetical protein VF195_04520 [Actinomycetota bacterium]
MTGALTSPISPSSIAMPTSVDKNDFATENDVCKVARSDPPKYRSYTRRSRWTTTNASVSFRRRNESKSAPAPSPSGIAPVRSISGSSGNGLTSSPAAITRDGNRCWSPTSVSRQTIARAVVDESTAAHAHA